MNFALDPFSERIQVPWMLEGAFIMSLILVHVQAAYLHSSNCRKWRLQTALTGVIAKMFSFPGQYIF
jgi:hypothetical protein